VGSRTRTDSADEMRLLVRTAVAYLPSRLVPAVVGAVAVPALAWFLSPADFGTYALVAAALPVAAVIVGDWAVVGYQRQAHLADEEAEAKTATWVALLGIGGAVLLVAAAMPGRQVEILAVGLLLVPYLLFRMQAIKLQMTGRAGRYSALQVGYTVARAACMVLAAALVGNVLAVLAGWLLANILVLLAGTRLRFRRSLSPSALAQLARVGVPLVAASLALHVIATADRFIVATLEGRDAAGIYAFGYLLGEGLITLPTSVPYLAASWLATRAFDDGRERAALGLIARLLRVQVVVAVAFVLVLAVAADGLLRLIAPAEYAVVGPVLGVVAAAQVPAGIVPYLILMATLRRQTRRVIGPSVAAAVVNVAVTVPAVMLAGITGAAAATVLTGLLYCVLLARAMCPRALATWAAVTGFVAVIAAAGAALADGLALVALVVLAAGAAAAIAMWGTGRSMPRSRS